MTTNDGPHFFRTEMCDMACRKVEDYTPTTERSETCFIHLLLSLHLPVTEQILQKR